jgi:predicted dienelactone hydrolase
MARTRLTSVIAILIPSALLFSSLSASSEHHPPPFYPDKAKLLVYRDAAGKDHPVRNAADWDKRRQHILANMQLVMGSLPDISRQVPLGVYVKEEVKTAKYVRRKISFAVEEDDRVPAYLLIPLERQGKLPAVLCLHQTVRIGKGEPAGLGDRENLRYAAHLAERGYVTLAPDYPSFGEYDFDFSRSRFPSGTMKAIWNNMRAIDLLQTLPEVDATRIGCIGHSLGGHNALFTAAFDTRIKAVVSSCGFTSFPKYYGGNLKGWTSPRYMPRIASVYDMKPEKMPFDFTEIVAALAPRAFLASAPIHDDNFEVSGVRDCIAAALPVYDLLGAKERLAAYYPDCGHDFPPGARKVAYEWLDRWLMVMHK